MTPPLVSVIIPTYNRAPIIEHAIDSVLNQTYANVEAIVVDDGSTDDTAAQIAARYGDDARVRYVWKENGGVSTARNRGFEEARGEFVALLDSDDVWLPWKIQTQVACLCRLPDAGMIWTDMKAMDPDGQIFDEHYLEKFYSSYRWHTREQLFDVAIPLLDVVPELGDVATSATLYQGDIFSQMVRGSLVHTSTVLLRRERLSRVGGFDESLGRSGEDFDFHLRTCREGPVAFIDVSSILYRCGAEDQLTGMRSLIAANFLRTVERTLATDGDRITLPPPVINEVLAGAHEWLGDVKLEAGDRSGARRHLLASLRLQPSRRRSMTLLVKSLLPAAVLAGFRRVKRGRAAVSQHS